MLDTHCHLNDKMFTDVNDVVNNFLTAGVEKAICIAWNYNSSLKAIELSSQFDSVYAAIGCHPDDCSTFNEQEIENLLKQNHKKVVAVGEIGLDYFHNKENKEEQKRVFISQINLANKYKLPIVIHCRDAFGDTLEILKQHKAEYGAVMHCYSGSLEFANELLKLGVKISFTGTVTYKNAVNLHEVAKNIPLDSFFFETDCPYLTPVPHRGKRNEPKYVVEVAKFVAELRGISAEELIKITDSNAKKFFKL